MPKPQRKPSPIEEYPDGDKRRDDALRRALAMPPQPKPPKGKKK
jgi:hypothetical protein